MSAGMMAAVYHGPRDVRIEQRTVPVAGPGELLLRVATVGVCGSDAGEWDHGPVQHPIGTPHPSSGHVGPIIPGHEFSGTVVAVGEGADPAWIGRQVASCGSVACGECGACTDGASNRCRRYVGVGLHRDGALAGFVSVPPEACVSIDGLGISLDEAALCQPMAIAVHCVARAGGVAGRLVVVLGIGGIGAFLTFALVDAGARVIAVDLDRERLGIADDLGAHRVLHVDGGAEDAGRIREAVGDDPLAVVFEVSGTAGGLATAIGISSVGTRIVAVGIQRGAVQIDLGALTVREQSIIGTNAQVRETDFPKAVELIAKRPGGWSQIAPTVIPLADVVEGALRPMAEGRATEIKVLIDPWVVEPRSIR